MTRKPVIAIIGAGQMGSAVGARCVAHGACVITPLAGRSIASHQRASAAGMHPCDFGQLMQAATILSIVPPGQAMAVAEELVPLLGPNTAPFIDANALEPATKYRMEEKVTATGGRFIDGAIIGGPPQGAEAGPRFYLSGKHAGAATFLRDLGLDIRDLERPVGAASALKMCYGGLNKGLTALTAATLLAAESSGVAEALMDELGYSQRFVRDRARTSLPAMYPKAYRWVAEFDEIARFIGASTPAGVMFEAIARFFEERALAGSMEAEIKRIGAVLGTRLNEGE